MKSHCSPLNFSLILYLLSAFILVQFLTAVPGKTAQPGTTLRSTIETLSDFGNRTTGSAGYEKSVRFVENKLQEFGLSPQSYLYQVPIRRFHGAELSINDHKNLPLLPLNNNIITPQTTDGTLSAPLYYVGKGELADLDGKNLAGSIVLIDFDSGRNWQLLASLGAKAAIFLQGENSKGRIFFTEKHELTPLQFPCFWLEKEQATKHLGPLKKQNSPLFDNVALHSRTVWENFLAKNIYTFIEGSDPELKNELLVVEAFFDNEGFVSTNSPGADAATSIATLLELAKTLSKQPPKRSTLLVATSGHAQTLAGMRDLIWSTTVKGKILRNQKKRLTKIIERQKSYLELLKGLDLPLRGDENQARDDLLSSSIKQSLDQAVDQVSRQLMQLRLGEQTETINAKIKETAKLRLLYRRLGWAERYDQLPEKQEELLSRIIPKAILQNEQTLQDSEHKFKALQSALKFRKQVKTHEVASIISLHLSSHGNGVGAFERGWLYNLKPQINRTSVYSPIAEILEKAGENSSGRARYQDSLRPSHLRSWDSWFFDKPNLGGEVSALAGYRGFSLVTTGDGRVLWGTPSDTVEHIDWGYLEDQTKLVKRLVLGLIHADTLQEGPRPKNGFVTVTGRTNLLLQGELFANYPALNSTILSYQGAGKYYAMVDATGHFVIKGVANKKHVLDKLIIEGYRFDEESGKVIWAIDKKETGKSNYRLKLLRRSMQTDLVMFNCRETTLFGLLEPRSFAYMTKLHLYDGRRDAPPEHYWYSRIDTRDSIISSIYTEPGTRLKLTLSDTVLTNKMILTNGREDKKLGLGYLVDEHPTIPNTTYHAAKDAWTLLGPRINNLEAHGIYDTRINELKERGLSALKTSREGLESLHYSVALKAASEALALAARVYVQVEKTQKDVLFGVLFYIALFVPFAFVMERFLFNFASIYKRIVGFCLILALLIAVIYNVHPAFELAYSPMVVILAFFIIGLSFMVTLIIFFRFEDEMILLQRRASQKRPEEISRWKAFVAAFFLGVSNLRRRRLRTLLTCTTLIILTFTIMSFTTIKSNQHQVRLPFEKKAPYQGLLLKKTNGQTLPPQATDILVGSMEDVSSPAPRIWMEGKDPARPVSVPLRNGNNEIEIQGMIGLSPSEAKVTGLDRLLTSGRWFTKEDTTVIILEEQTAARLGLVYRGDAQHVILWGFPFTFIGTFKAESFDRALDLDGEPLTPVIYPDEAGAEVTEEEMEAMESGDDVRSFQSRYRHIPAGQIAIIPARTLLAAGGKLKNIAIRLEDNSRIEELAKTLADRFSLAIFTGEEDGVWLYNVSDTMHYRGVPNIIIPLLISILIVLNTMISSVHERKSEIAVYTSVGLAPSHVGFLFVAEAMALAVISVVTGYLVAQISAALLSATPLWEGITVNYSSMAGVAAMLLVIGVVLISVLYPAKLAARIAIPDVNRTFKLPKPKDNEITVILPFLMKYREHESIGGFVYEYLSSHRDISHGIFSTGPVEVVFSCSTVDEIYKMVAESDRPNDLRCLHIRANVWLAPFDFGIMQTVDIQFCPAMEGEEFLEIKISLKRQSGESAIWQRINTSFLHEIRKQLLVWRSFDHETHLQLQDSFQQVLADKGLAPEVI